MQFPITIGLRRSRFLDTALLLVAFLASLAVLCLPQATVIQFVICAAIWIIAGLTWRHLTPSFSAIRLEHSGQVSVAIEDKTDFFACRDITGCDCSSLDYGNQIENREWPFKAIDCYGRLTK